MYASNVKQLHRKFLFLCLGVCMLLQHSPKILWFETADLTWIPGLVNW